MHFKRMLSSISMCIYVGYICYTQKHRITFLFAFVRKIGSTEVSFAFMIVITAIILCITQWQDDEQSSVIDSVTIQNLWRFFSVLQWGFC